MGKKENPAAIFFRAMGVTGGISMRAREYLEDDYLVILPSSSVCSEGHKYIQEEDEGRQAVTFLNDTGVGKPAPAVSSSIGADLAPAFPSSSPVPVGKACFDGGLSA